MNKSKLVILVGIDGSGKSSLLSHLEKEGYFVSHWRRLAKLSLPEPLNFKNPAEVVQTLRGRRRLEFIWGYISSEWEYLIKPTLESGKNVISDGFFIRFFIKEKIYKRLSTSELLERSPLTGGEFVIMIDAPPQIAFRRKGTLKISPYECFEGPEDFVYFQTLQRGALLNYVEKFPHVVVNGMLAREKLAEEVLKTLRENQIDP